MVNQWVYDLVFGKEGTPNQHKASKLSGAQRTYPLNSYVGVLFPYHIKGRVEDYRLNSDDESLAITEVEIKINGKWYPKSLVTKSVAVLKAIK